MKQKPDLSFWNFKNIPYAGCRPTLAELLLDTPPIDGYSGSAYRWNT